MHMRKTKGLDTASARSAECQRLLGKRKPFLWRVPRPEVRISSIGASQWLMLCGTVAQAVLWGSTIANDHEDHEMARQDDRRCRLYPA